MAVLLAGLSALAVVPARADEVPSNLGLLVMLKVLTYDSGFEGRGGDGEFLVLVPFANAQTSTAHALVEVGVGLATQSIQGRKLHFEAISSVDLDTQLFARKPGALLIPADTPTDVAKQFSVLAQKHKIYTMCLDEALVKAGFTVGVGLNNGKPQVLINIASARAINADFNTSVMRVARVYQ